MKKKMYFLFVFILCLFCASNLNSASLTSAFADNTTVSNISISMHYLQNELEVQKENEIYQINFENNTQIPYQTYKIKTDITMADASSATTEIINQITWTVENLTNETTQNVSFSSNIFNDEYYTLELIGKDINITPLKPCTLNIICSLQSSQSQISVCCNYANLERINIQNNNSLTQLYETFSDIVLNAVFEFEDFVDPTLTFNYIWKIGTTTLSNKTSSITITKDMIKIGTTEISVEIENNKKLSATVELVISTNEDYVINITHSGNLVQTYDEHNQPIKFTADVPITKEYQISWFLKYPNSHIYKKQNIQSNQKDYTFNPLQNIVGTYKIFAQATIDNVYVKSDIYEIVINPKPATEEHEFTITTNAYSNTSTNVQAFDCKIDTENYYEEDEIVWMINKEAYATGSHIKFEPSLAGEYVIVVKLLNADGTVGEAISKTITLNAKTIQQNALWIYISIAVVCLVAICISSILISNKMREKIW